MSRDYCMNLAARALEHAGTPMPEAAEADTAAFRSHIMSVAIALAIYDRKDSWDHADDAERDRVAWQLAACALGTQLSTTEASTNLNVIRDERWREHARQRLIQVISEES